MRRTGIVGLMAGLLLAACGGQAAPVPTPPPGVVAANNLALLPDFVAEVYATGLRGPTALGYGPDHKLYVTQLNGPESSENSGAGQVVRLDGPGAAPVVVLDKLSKPTGLAWRGDELWLVTGRAIARALLQDGQITPPAVVVAALPSNGRSNGQITLLPDRSLLFESSGGSDPSSAALLVLKPNSTTPEVYATGFKGAYAQASDINSGAVWATEINDDPLGGAVPPEELNQVQPGKNYGWPQCFANQEPATERGATRKSCKATEPPLALFEPHATPTGLEWGGNTKWPAPFDHGLFVALWNGQPPRVALVQLGDTIDTPATTFVGGLERPIDVMAAREGGLFVLDFATGKLYLIRNVGRR